jgi:eukaryotic-like serine/threonine-protein kinase
MGSVYEALHADLGKRLAIKVVRSELANSPEVLVRFRREARAACAIDSDHVAQIYDFGTDEEVGLYMVIEYLEGEDLETRLSREKWLSICEAGTIGVHVARGLAKAHAAGIIHRDLKPANVMIAGFGQVYVMDWGLSRLSKTRPASGKAAQMEAPGPVGTPDYMPPEQARGNPAEMNERSDVFGLGALLYEIVSGKTPYGEHVDANEVLRRARAGAVIPIETAAASIGISRKLRQIVTRATAAAPADRYASVVELQNDVSSFLRGGLHLPRKLFAPGAIIIREGDVGDAAYMIVSGRCRAYRTVGAEQETLAVMSGGDVFGEMALLLDEPRAASVEALDAVTVLVLDKHTMTEGLGIGGWTGALVRALAQRFRDLEQQVRDSGMRRG